MRFRPAGTETRAPTPGIKCPTSIALPPLRSNTLLAPSRSDTKTSLERSNRFTTRRKRASLIRSPTRYRTSEADTLAAVAASSTGKKERRPCPTRNPNSGRVNSVGTGRYRLPARMRTNTPTYPKDRTTSSTHPTSSASGAPIAPYPPISSTIRPNYAPYDPTHDPGWHHRTVLCVPRLGIRSCAKPPWLNKPTPRYVRLSFSSPVRCWRRREVECTGQGFEALVLALPKQDSALLLARPQLRPEFRAHSHVRHL